MGRQKITEQDIIDINTLYIKIGSYSRVADILGFSTSTVRKYVASDLKPESTLIPRESLEFSAYDDIDDFGDISDT